MTDNLNSTPAELRQILFAVRDWGEGLAHQEFDDDPLPGMSPKEAEAALLAWHEAELAKALERAIPEKKIIPGWDHTTTLNSKWGYNQAIDDMKTALRDGAKGLE